MPCCQFLSNKVSLHDLPKWHKSNRNQFNDSLKSGIIWSETTGTIKPKWVAQIEPNYPIRLLSTRLGINHLILEVLKSQFFKINKVQHSLIDLALKKVLYRQKIDPDI